jgi:AbrB family transcriptional regulator (stage V sporulation protein T)
MKATGIVRRIDDLGRVVIPKEIRRTMRIREGDPLEIYTGNDGEVIFKKYSPLGELGTFAAQYAEVLHRTGGHPVVVCDRDHVIAVAGIPKKEMLERRVSSTLEDIMEQRKVFGNGDASKTQPVEGIDRFAVSGAPIIASGDVCGVIMFVADENSATAGDSEMKLITTAAAFLGKQMEE